MVSAPPKPAATFAATFAENGLRAAGSDVGSALIQSAPVRGTGLEKGLSNFETGVERGLRNFDTGIEKGLSALGDAAVQVALILAVGALAWKAMDLFARRRRRRGDDNDDSD
ncbi:MAG: hypothetical protein MHM6MM_008381 [Cercozoa sp. M6MM]